ncbi:hypothetical protein Pmani_031270 [Petrolisthes manimaculis]|uniref:Uncharacterized protein n=1 Tax=Petrolisthes manimaculis TaxID=1843537 RepID=A0AAE1NU71_9EUCA|nr:hypothetical protein Pmani_031270 [Petrolisthes manimaculis]
MAAMVAARPDFDFDAEDMHQDQDIGNGNVITGTYSWTSPEGTQYFVKYVADRNGYRVVDSNAVPATANGVRANGAQGAFSSEEDISFGSDENDSFFDDK